MNIVYDEKFVNLTCHTSDWMIDSSSQFHVTTHHELVLKDVRHVSDIYLNLISTGKFDDDGYTN